MPFAPGKDGSCPIFQRTVQTRRHGINCGSGFPKAWQTMVNAACARDFPAYSFGEVVAAASTVQRCEVCETIFESEAALRTHMYRVHGNRGLARRFVADTQCPVCKKSFVTRARVVQHGSNTRCKHAMLNGGCVENAPEEQPRLDHEMAVFRCNARRAGLSFLACTKGWFFSSVARLPFWVVASPVSPTCAFAFFAATVTNLHLHDFSSTDIV